MKKKSILIATTVAVIAAAGICFCYNANQNEGLSAIQLANIEALADGEFIAGHGWECFNVVYDDVTNPQFITVINCNGCHVTSAVYVNTPKYCTLSGMYD